jgi:hypothetical protein
MGIRQGCPERPDLCPKHHCQDRQNEKSNAQPDGDPEKDLLNATTLRIDPASLAAPGQSTQANTLALQDDARNQGN